MGFLTLDAFKNSVSRSLEARSQAILGADVVLSSSRALKPQEIQLAQSLLPKGAMAREERSFFSMAWNGSASRLVEIRAIDEAFPYYGELQLEHGGNITHRHPKSLTQGHSVWIYPELAIQLGLKLGDELQLGEARFRVDDIIKSDPSISNMSFSPAPKVMMGLEQLKTTGLLGYGSRQSHRWLVALPQGLDVETWSQQLRLSFPQSDLKVQTHREASQQIARLLAYLGDYLGLVSLVALFLSAVGTAYLFQSFVELRQKNLATLMALGLPFSSIVAITLIQLTLMGILACTLSIGGCAILLPYLPDLLGELMVDRVELSLGWRSLGLALLTGLGGAFFFSYPAFHRLALIKPAELFRESPSQQKSSGSWAAWLPTLFVFWGLSIWQAQSWKVASIFMGAFLLALSFISLSGWLGFALLEKSFSRHWPWIPRLAILQLCRRRRPSQACFLALGLGSFLLILIPQLSEVMRAELQMGGREERPRLFLFDIQPEQREELQQFFDKTPARLQNLSPLVSARLLSIKGENIHLASEGFGREAERDQNFRNRSLNLSSRSDLDHSESLVEGQHFSGPYNPAQKFIEASLEVRYAQRLGLKIGDRFSVDVLGLELQAQVVNLRKVRWTSFQPNFFMIFQPGVLEDAPRTYLASVLDRRDPSSMAQFQKDLVAQFSNLGVVDITQTLERLLGIVGQMLFAIQVTSWVSTLAALGVLFSISRQQLRARLRDLALIRLLGALPQAARQLITLEFLFLGLLAGSVGLLCGLGGSLCLSWFLFDGSMVLNVPLAVVQVLGLVALTVLTGLLSSYRALGQRLGQLKMNLDVSW